MRSKLEQYSRLELIADLAINVIHAVYMVVAEMEEYSTLAKELNEMRIRLIKIRDMAALNAQELRKEG